MWIVCRCTEYNPVRGRTIALTGWMVDSRGNTYTRTSVANAIFKLGGRHTSSITRGCDLLVIGVEPGNSKISTATIMRVRTMYSSQFVDEIRKLKGVVLTEQNHVPSAISSLASWGELGRVPRSQSITPST